MVLPLSNWFISLNIIISRSIHAVAKGKISFFCRGRNLVFHWVKGPQPFLCSSTDWHLGSFQILAMVNNINNLQWTQSFKLVFRVSSDIFPEVGSLGQKADLFLIFWGNSMLFSTLFFSCWWISLACNLFNLFHHYK